MDIREVPLAVTDVETTGTKAGSDRIIEVGAVKVLGGKVVDRFSQLVNPGRSIPSRITRLTGISSAMVFDKPAAEDVLSEYLAFLGSGIFVAHNLPFDERFMNAELERIGHGPLPNEKLCTLRLARRLLPGLRSKSLASLIDFYKLRPENRHRALADAEATATILLRFLSQLEFEHDIHSKERTLAFQRKNYRQIRKAPGHLEQLRENVLPHLPDGPGVYFMKGQSGNTLYIGKAKNLQTRVRSYFNAIEAKASHKRDLMKAVRSITWQETESELEALLLESRLIKEQKPRFNRTQRRYRRRPFLRLDTTERFPRVDVCFQVEGDGAEYFGPLRGRGEASFVVELINRFFQIRECEDEVLREGKRCFFAEIDRCTAPCEGGEGARLHREAVDAVRAFLTGQDHTILDRLERAMYRASRRYEYEKAARLRDWHERLERLLARQQAVAAPVLDHHAVLVRPDGRAVRFLCIRFGRHVGTITAERPVGETQRVQLLRRIADWFRAPCDRPERLSKREVDEVRLLSHWMYLRREEIEQVRWEATSDPEHFAEGVVQRVLSTEEGVVDGQV